MSSTTSRAMYRCSPLDNSFLALEWLRWQSGTIDVQLCGLRRALHGISYFPSIHIVLFAKMHVCPWITVDTFTLNSS